MKSVTVLMGCIGFAISVSPQAAVPVAAGGAALKATVPMVLEDHRPYVNFQLTGPDGRTVTAHFYVDTGGGAIVFTTALAQRLGIKPAGNPLREEGGELVPARIPEFSLGRMKLVLTGVQAYIVMQAAGGLQGTDAEGGFPARALRHYQVILDYPGRKFTVAAPGALKPAGTPVNTYIGEAGMPVVTASVDGKSHDFLLDSGGTYCMISAVALDAWGKRHPQWPQVKGAYGPADMLTGAGETGFTMLRVGALQWGPFTLTDVGTVSRPAGAYERFMSRIAGKPVIGSIAGNVLQGFRVDIDYPHGQVYLSRVPGIHDAPLDMVGVTLELGKSGYVVAGTAPGVTAIHKGDRLLRVGTLDAQTATLAEILRALQGKVGTHKNLLIERGGQRLEIQARVRPIL
ncbi:MAG: hypothetical protein ACYDB9_10085 [Gammaproteobacteria bacterium]